MPAVSRIQRHPSIIVFQSYTEPNDYRFHNLRYLREIKKVAEDISGSSDQADQPYTANSESSTTNYSISDLFDFVKTNDKDFKPNSVSEHLDEVNAMEPVADIKYEVTTKQQAIKDAAKAFKRFGDQIDRQGYGIISLTEKELNESIKYEYTASEWAAWQVVPYVLKRGKDISGHGNHKDRSYATRTIAAPVVINDKKGVVGVVIRLTKGSKYKNHRILMPNGSEYVFENQKDAEPTFAGVKGENHRQGPAISSASDTIISQNPEKSTPEVKKSKKIQPSYAGDKSKTANHSLLAQAEKLESRGGLRVKK